MDILPNLDGLGQAADALEDSLVLVVVLVVFLGVVVVAVKGAVFPFRVEDEQSTGHQALEYLSLP